MRPTDVGGADAPLIGVDGMSAPKWAVASGKVAAAGWWQTVRSVPSAVATVAGLVHVASGCATAFGLLATANVLTALLEQGPTPERLVASLPAILLVVASLSA